ncbi:hypothetical protein C8F01DRAFT_510582 [Mycena amicta]|nr:hypothetical protein C8F01DRAFT_510582 [Mycena amicta]
MSEFVYITTLVPATYYGDTNGDAFYDLQAVQGTTPIVFDTVARAIETIKVMNSDCAVDGIQITYGPSNHDGAKHIVAHGTTDKCTDPNLNKSVVTISDAETITSISGTTDTTDAYGLRVTSLSFDILNNETGIPRTAGPFGGSTGTAFTLNVIGEFIALSGFAFNTDQSLAQLAASGGDGGLYGLAFDQTNFQVSA